MTLNQLRYFCMASRCHSITKAAEELYVTQPTVSVAIRDLEIEFGVSLFSRKGNQLILTREGEEFYQKANYILQYCNELQADYSNLSRVRPPIRIGIPPMLSTVFFPELLLAFSEEHPEIAVSLEEYGSVRACNLVQDDTLDLALVNMEQYNIDKFHHAVLADDQVVFCVAKNHPLAGREVVSIQDMAKQPLIFFNADSVQNQLLKLRFELEGYTPNIIMRSSQIYTTLQFLKTGRYACFLYSSMTDKFPEIIGIPMPDTNSSENRHDMEEKQIHQQRYADADLFYKKVLSDAFVDSIGQKNERGLNISPPFSVIFFYFSGKSYRTISQFFTPNAAYSSFVIS